MKVSRFSGNGVVESCVMEERNRGGNEKGNYMCTIIIIGSRHFGGCRCWQTSPLLLLSLSNNISTTLVGPTPADEKSKPDETADALAHSFIVDSTEAHQIAITVYIIIITLRSTLFVDMFVFFPPARTYVSMTDWPSLHYVSLCFLREKKKKKMGKYWLDWSCLIRLLLLLLFHHPPLREGLMGNWTGIFLFYSFFFCVLGADDCVNAVVCRQLITQASSPSCVYSCSHRPFAPANNRHREPGSSHSRSAVRHSILSV